MHEALHPHVRRRITVTQYIAEFGRLPTNHKGPDYRPPARCPFCVQHLSIVGDKSNKTDGHFAHRPKGGFCPSKKPAGKPYLELTPRASNPAAGRALRADFKRTWQLHYRHLESIVPALHYREFLALLDLSERWRIWEYAKLDLGHIPYVFIVLADFPPASGRLNPDGSFMRRLWLRFLYDSSLRHIEDLWIRPAAPRALYRVTYTAPARAAAPGLKDLLKSTPLKIDTSFIAPGAPSKPVDTWLEGIVNNWFATHWPGI